MESKLITLMRQLTVCVIAMMMLDGRALSLQNSAVIRDVQKPPKGESSYADKEPVENLDIYFYDKDRWDQGWRGLPLNVHDEVRIQKPDKPRIYKLLIDYADPRRKSVALREGSHIRIEAEEIQVKDGSIMSWIVGKIRTTASFLQASPTGTQYGLEMNGQRARLFVWEGQLEVKNAAGTVTVGERQLTEVIEGRRPTEPRVPRFEEIKDFVVWGLELDPSIRKRLSDQSSQLHLHENLIRAEFESRVNLDLVVPKITLGHLYLALGQYEQSLRVFDEAERINRRPGEIYNGRGIIYTLTSQPGYSPREQFEMALRRDNRSSFHNNLGVYYLDQASTIRGDAQLTLHHAAVQFREAIGRNAGNDTAYNGLGVALLQSGQWQEAKKELEKAVQTKPRAVSLNNLGIACLLQNESDEAADHYQRAITLAPHDAAVANNLGVYYLKKREYTEAANQFLKSLQSAPTDLAMCYNLGLVYLFQPQLRQTIKQSLEGMSAKSPEGSPPIQGYLSFLSTIEGLQPNQAEQYDQYFELLKTDIEKQSHP